MLLHPRVWKIFLLNRQTSKSEALNVNVNFLVFKVSRSGAHSLPVIDFYVRLIYILKKGLFHVHTSGNIRTILGQTALKSS